MKVKVFKNKNWECVNYTDSVIIIHFFLIIMLNNFMYYNDEMEISRKYN